MSWLLGIFAWVIGKLFGKTPGPSQEAVQAKAAGVAQTEVAVDDKALVEVGQAQAARAVVDRLPDDVLRQPSPDSRD